MHNPTLQPIIRARHQALRLLESLAGAFDAHPDVLVRAFDAVWELYWEALYTCGSDHNALRNFVRGFMNVLASLDQSTTPIPQPAAMAA